MYFIRKKRAKNLLIFAKKCVGPHLDHIFSQNNLVTMFTAQFHAGWSLHGRPLKISKA
jgi:hypothetical protein